MDANVSIVLSVIIRSLCLPPASLYTFIWFTLPLATAESIISFFTPIPTDKSATTDMTPIITPRTVRNVRTFLLFIFIRHKCHIHLINYFSLSFLCSIPFPFIGTYLLLKTPPESSFFSCAFSLHRPSPLL